MTIIPRPHLHAPLLRRSPRENAFYSILLFLLPLVFLFKYSGYGTFIYIEPVLFLFGAWVLFLVLNHNPDRVFRRICILGLLWLASQITTDIVNGTEFEDYSRGWARIGFFLTNMVCVWWLVDNRPRRVFWLAVGVFVSGLAASFLYLGLEFDAYTWKGGWMVPVTGFFVLTAGCFKNGFIGGVLLIMAAVVSAYMHGRALAGICFGSGLFLMVAHLYGKRRSVGLALSTKALICMLMLLFFLLFISIATRFAASGKLGEEARQKNSYQIERGNEFLGDMPMPMRWLLAPLFGGRIELMVSYQAVAESPLLGYGSWAKDPRFVELFAVYEGKSVEQLRAESSEGYVDRGLIPTHSHFFGSWVDAGLVGALFWGFIFLLVVESLFVLLVAPMEHKAIFVYFLMNAAWDIWFSPFDTPRRLLDAMVVTIACVVINNGLRTHGPLRMALGRMSRRRLSSGVASP